MEVRVECNTMSLRRFAFWGLAATECFAANYQNRKARQYDHTGKLECRMFFTINYHTHVGSKYPVHGAPGVGSKFGQPINQIRIMRVVRCRLLFQYVHEFVYSKRRLILCN